MHWTWSRASWEQSLPVGPQPGPAELKCTRGSSRSGRLLHRAWSCLPYLPVILTSFSERGEAVSHAPPFSHYAHSHGKPGLAATGYVGMAHTSVSLSVQVLP